MDLRCHPLATTDRSVTPPPAVTTRDPFGPIVRIELWSYDARLKQETLSIPVSDMQAVIRIDGRPYRRMSEDSRSGKPRYQEWR